MHSDHLGTASLTTDHLGAVKHQVRHYPFGEQRWSSGGDLSDYDFTGQRLDGFGLHDYNARYYDSVIGRFISADTIVPDFANPQSLNRYAYTLNNPVRYRDPSGHWIETAWDIASIGIGIASLTYNIQQGNTTDAWIDAGGLVVDVGAAIIPVVPGGASAVIKAARLANKVDDVADAAKLISKGDEVLDVVTHADEITNANKFWNKVTDFDGAKVYQRNDLIDPNFVDARGRTNLERMQSGLAPIGSDGKSINLHHMTQANDSAIAEVTQTFHQTNHGTIHINPNTIPSGIDRSAFNKWRSNYWKNRADDFLQQ